MSYYVNVEKEGQETKVKGFALGKEFVVASGKPGGEWTVDFKEGFPKDLDSCVEFANVVNSVMIEAKKLCIESNVRIVDFAFASFSEEDLETQLTDEIYDLGTRYDMEVEEVRKVMFRDTDGRLFEITYSCYLEYDHTEHLQVDSYEEIK